MKKRDGFSSQFGAMLAMIGSAVGLGGLWKFPYTAGQNGGAAFILIYIVFLFILCFPLMLSELVIGRRSGANAVGAFRKLAPKTKWFLTGSLGIVTCVIILSFYTVVGGWTTEYLIKSFYPGIKTVASDDFYFTTFKNDAIKPIISHLIFFVISVAILWTGIKDGIEKYSKILMPSLFMMVICLAIFSLTLPNSMEGVKFMLLFKFHDITPSVILNALGMGLFTLSLGMAIVMTYSSYIAKKENLISLSVSTILSSLIFSILAGLIILPAVFSFGYKPDEGPGLIFIILPKIFAAMPFGSIVAPVFFSMAFIAAISSAISLLEVVTTYMTEEWNLSRKTSLLISTAFFGILGALCSLSLGVLDNFHILGRNIFSLFDDVSSTLFMPICAFFVAIFVGWRMKIADVYDELKTGSNVNEFFLKGFTFLIRYFVPLAIIIIFLYNLAEKIEFKIFD